MPMKIYLYTLAIFVLSAISLGQSPQAKVTPHVSEPVDASDSIEGKVVSVENGDTIIVQVKGSVPYTYLVKLRAVDAPDIGQPYFENARKTLSKLILKKDVKVAVHTTYSRGMIIGTVYHDDRDVGLGLLERGLAWHFKRFAYQQHDIERKSYSDAQEYALNAGLGIWSDDRPTPPWVFRGEGASSIPESVETGSSKQLPSNSVPQTASATLPVSRESNKSKKTLSPTHNGRKYLLGPRGGCYYVSASGGKVYVQDKSLCGVVAPETKP